jgi:hypothetical protein
VAFRTVVVIAGAAPEERDAGDQDQQRPLERPASGQHLPKFRDRRATVSRTGALLCSNPILSGVVKHALIEIRASDVTFAITGK